MKLNAKVFFCEKKSYEGNEYFKLTVVADGIQGFAVYSTSYPVKPGDIIQLVPYVNNKHKLDFRIAD